MSVPIGPRLGAALLLILAVGWADGQTPQPGKAPPKLEAVAETRLLMEGLAQANFKGLERLLDRKPTEDETWIFTRGQALLLAETANLLMLRPPKNLGEQVWMERSMELRTGAVSLAKHLANKDYDKARAGMYLVAGICNRCHQTFRVAVDVRPFAPPAPVRKVGTVERQD